MNGISGRGGISGISAVIDWLGAGAWVACTIAGLGRACRRCGRLLERLQPIDAALRIARGMHVRRAQVDAGHVQARGQRFGIDATHGQRVPLQQRRALSVAQVEFAQRHVARYPQAGRAVARLLEGQLQIGVQQGALHGQRQRARPCIGKLVQLQLQECQVQRRAWYVVKGPRRAVQGEGAAIDPGVQARLHIDVGGIAEVGNEWDAKPDLVDDVLPPGDLVIERDRALVQDQIVERKARQALLFGLLGGRFFGRQLGHALDDVGEIEMHRAIAHQGQLRAMHVQAVDDGGKAHQ